MRINPVYLVAPQPAVATPQPRRAFLLGSLTTLACATFGTIGFLAGRYTNGTSNSGAQATTPPTTDETLQFLRRLAHPDTPIAELTTEFDRFVGFLQAYPNDAAAWRGVDRLLDEVEREPTAPGNRRIATILDKLLANVESAETRSRRARSAAVRRATR